ncbi:hypothetical protein KC332_g3828 [Hortaea werneckii]|uniref:HIT-type domain-containing protein n=2 Tax=Hortaea werneckii TaxID=91943 RepID=A0A3M7I5Q2_HORWE|nr:hypothetical protein KC358_g10412 [Hortaea werneckii]OTA38052.1 hypothetical protein BTJ68_02104 [Hortaea werneckii EXF-2000]KAI6834056.1 hypothetical protein KC350_g6822 [Hortaea werneckii]KAI6935097.1 hypothetical protein KC341_g7146 [Hortaea werneckii]KAI6942132.1 hypothetical protein KC348_g4510 [Hortaea werneckii]
MPENNSGSLSDLCSTCYTEQPKYRCPRCQTQTCSLPCYKKHQQRASCNGKRDPAAYQKKSQLATASGLDRDYNYLKGVERQIDVAGQEAEDRGIGAKNASSKNVLRGWRADSALQRYLVQNNINIEHAPKGMSRQKNNQTRPTKSNRIVWTVEWLTADGQRTLQHDCTESDSIISLYETHLADLSHIEGQPRGSKRKRVETSSAKQPPQPDIKPEGDLERTSDNAASGATAPRTLGDSESELQSEATPASNTGDPAPKETSTPPPTEEHRPPTNSQEPTASTDTDTPQQPANQKPRYFYLLKPGTSSTSKVLLPLKEEASLTASLQDQTVQEYPTVVLLAHSPEKLPLGYVLLEQYLKAQASEDAELHAALAAAGKSMEAVKTELPMPPPSSSSQHGEKEELDAESILNMLKRDIR